MGSKTGVMTALITKSSASVRTTSVHMFLAEFYHVLLCVFCSPYTLSDM